MVSSSMIRSTSRPFCFSAFSPAAAKARKALRICWCSSLSTTMASVDTGCPLSDRRCAAEVPHRSPVMRSSCTACARPRRVRLPQHRRRTEGWVMGLDDKMRNKAKDAKGKAKEATGAATGNDKLKTEGRDEQGRAKAKEAGRHAKEAGKSVKDSLKR